MLTKSVEQGVCDFCLTEQRVLAAKEGTRRVAICATCSYWAAQAIIAPDPTPEPAPQ